jgi:broad specificity phosphatase PhoE
MARLHLVRHGRAAAGWSVDPDPSLDDLGRNQAVEVAQGLQTLGPLPIFSSPLARCQQTAMPLSALWSVNPIVEPLVAEIPSPEGIELADRVTWLRAAMAGTWSQLVASDGQRYGDYRTSVLGVLATMPEETVIFSHFIAINVVIGEALGDDRIVVASLDNCSVTTVSVANGVFTLEQMGKEADTLIR